MKFNFFGNEIELGLDHIFVIIAGGFHRRNSDSGA